MKNNVVYIFNCSEFPTKRNKLHSTLRKAKLEARKHIKIYGDSGNNTISQQEIDGPVSAPLKSALIKNKWIDFNN